MVGCVRNVSTVKFYPKETVKEEVTTEEIITEEKTEILYTNSDYETKVIEPDVYVSEGDFITSEYVEANITLPENTYIISTYVSGYDIFYATRNGFQAKIFCYNCETGDTVEIKSYGYVYSIDIVDVNGDYIAWKVYSYNDPLYGYDGTEKYNMCQIMNIETGEVFEYASLGAGNDFLGFTGYACAIGVDYDPITWTGTVYIYDFLDEKSEVLLEDLHDFIVHVSNNGYIIVELCYDSGSYGYEIYDESGGFIQRFVFPTYLDNVQYTGWLFAASIREEDGQYIYVFDCHGEKLHKYKYNGTYDFVCYDERVYTRGNNNSGVKVWEVIGSVVKADERYINDNVEMLGYYDFGIYTYLFELVDDCESYTFKLYRE